MLISRSVISHSNAVALVINYVVYFARKFELLFVREFIAVMTLGINYRVPLKPEKCWRFYKLKQETANEYGFIVSKWLCHNNKTLIDTEGVKLLTRNS